jgi:hypothetical protein
MSDEGDCLAQHSRPFAKPIRYMLSRSGVLHPLPRRWTSLLVEHAAERALRCVAVGRRNWTFAGSDEGGRRAAAIYPLVQTCCLNDVDPQAWLAEVLARLPDHPAKRVSELTPWAWKRAAPQAFSSPPNTPPTIPPHLAQHPSGRLPDAYADACS